MLRRLFLPVIALAVAAGTVFYAKQFLDTSPTTEGNDPVVVDDNPMRRVLVASAEVLPGSFIREDAVVWQEWPDVELPEPFFVDNEVEIVDLGAAVTREGLTPGEPLTESDIVFPGERGFLAAVLKPGTRAVSVPVNETSSNAGLILPGDRVDLILTQALSDDSGARERWVSETVLEDLRVIAMGRRLQPAADDAPVSAAADVRTTTLEVSPEGAEVVALVTDLGRLTLSLRSLSTSGSELESTGGETAKQEGDGETEPTPLIATERYRSMQERLTPFTRDSDVSEILRREDEAQDVLRVVRGPEQQLLDLDSEANQ